MIRRGACQKFYSYLAPWLSSAIAIAIAAERAKVFAEAMSDEKTLPLGEVEQQKNSSIKTRAEACKQFEGKVVTYYDQSTFVQDCKQHPIDDVDVFNEVIKLPGMTVNEVPAKVYRLIPFGSSFTARDLAALKIQSKSTPPTAGCFGVEGQYVTANGSEYYLVDKCKKHAFKDYFSLEQHNVTKKAIVSVSRETLNAIPSGPAIVIKKSEFGVLYKMDGDSNWSKLYRNRTGNAAEQDTPQTLENIEATAAKKVDKTELCKQLSNKVVSYYTQVFFADGCTLRPIKDYATSILFQQRVDEIGGVLDLTPEQKRVLIEGKAIDVGEAVKRMR